MDRTSSRFKNAVRLQSFFKEFKNGFDDLTLGNNTKVAVLVYNLTKHDPNVEVVVENVSTDFIDLDAFHATVYAGVAREIERLKKIRQTNRNDFLYNYYSIIFEMILDGNEVIKKSMSPIEILVLYYAYHYLELENTIKWELFFVGFNRNARNAMAKTIKNGKALNSIPSTQLEKFLEVRDDIDYLDIIKMPGFSSNLEINRHAAALFYYMDSRYTPYPFFNVSYDDIFFKEIMSFNPSDVMDIYCKIL